MLEKGPKIISEHACLLGTLEHMQPMKRGRKYGRKEPTLFGWIMFCFCAVYGQVAGCVLSAYWSAIPSAGLPACPSAYLPNQPGVTWTRSRSR